MTNCLISILICSFDLIAFFHDCEEFDVQFPVETEIPSRYRSQYSFVRSENGNFGNVRVHQLFINRGVSMSLIFPLAIQ